MKRPLSALSLLTRLPVPGGGLAAEDLRHAAPHFALVGLLLGALCWLCAMLLQPLLGERLTACLIVLALAIATGALHLDGIADVCDGMGSGRGDRKRTMDIMRDPRLGTFGVAGLCMVLLLKSAGLERCLGEHALSTLWLAPSCARAAIVPLLLLPNARPGGLGDLVRPAQPVLALVLNAVVIGLALWIFGLWLWPGLLACALCSGALGLWAIRRLGGVSGDVLGAAIESGEVAFVITAAAFAG